MAAPAPQPAKARVVVWHARGKPPRPELSAAINRPGFRCVRCEHAWAAFAHVTSRAGDCAPLPGESMVLLVVEPADLQGLTDVIDMIDRYTPSAKIWAYESAASPRLREVAADDLAGWRGEPPVKPHEGEVAPKPANPTPSSPPGLRLAGEGALPPERSSIDTPDTPHPHPDVKMRPPESGPVQDGAATPQPPITPLLSDEELAMLLSGDLDVRR